MRRTTSLAATVLAAAAILIGTVSVTLASPPSGVTPTVLVRGTFPEFNVQSNPDNGGLFKAQAKAPIDVVVRQHDYAPGASTGWHSHPYPVLITVKSGTLTFYEYDDPTCTPIVVTAGHGYVDSGRGHIGRNETSEPATDISVIMAPVGQPFRAELSAPNPNCGF